MKALEDKEPFNGYRNGYKLGRISSSEGRIDVEIPGT